MKNNLIFYVLMFALIGAVSIATLNNYAKIESLNQDIEDVNKVIAQREDEIEEINFQIDKTDDLAYIEKYVREKFGFVKANEIVFIAAEE
ncbi:MAG: FtsB family cell division protein [Lachnospirales bacterium]